MPVQISVPLYDAVLDDVQRSPLKVTMALPSHLLVSRLRQGKFKQYLFILKEFKRKRVAGTGKVSYFVHRQFIYANM